MPGDGSEEFRNWMQEAVKSLAIAESILDVMQELKLTKHEVRGVGHYVQLEGRLTEHQAALIVNLTEGR